MTGKESIVASSSFVQRYPASNASGARVAFSAFEKDKWMVYLSVPGEAPEKLCEGCLRATDWSRDEKALLVFGGQAIHSFTAVMMFGVVLVGTYTSIFIAAPILIYLGVGEHRDAPDKPAKK